MLYRHRRPTGDKWIARYHNHGAEGLEQGPIITPAPEVAARIVHEKLAGPKKVMDRLRAVEPDTPCQPTAPQATSSRNAWSDKGASAAT